MDDFTQDGLRYFLLRQAVPHSDANYSVAKIKRILNSELADTFGNLVNRCFSKAMNPEGEIPDPNEYVDVLKSGVAAENKKLLESLREISQKHYDEYHLHHVVDSVMQTLRSTNQMIDHHKPWILKKSDDPDSLREVKAVISLAAENIRVSSLVLYPIVPRLACHLLDLMQIPEENRTWNDTVPLYLNSPSTGAKRVKTSSSVLFKKLG